VALLRGKGHLQFLNLKKIIQMVLYMSDFRNLKAHQFRNSGHGIPKATCFVLCLGVDFTNIFTRRFYAHSSQKHKSQSSRQYLFTLLGSARVKAVRKTLMKLSLGRLVSCLLDFKTMQYCRYIRTRNAAAGFITLYLDCLATFATTTIMLSKALRSVIII